MQALTVTPGRSGSAQLEEIGEPDPADGALLVETLAVGICGTDLEIAQGEYGEPPPGHQRLVLGHESLGRVLEAPDGGAHAAGDLVVGIVRQPDPEPCPNCAVGEWDMCRNGNYTEHGIMRLDGFARERYRIEPDFAVRVDPRLAEVGVLLEPTSVVAKAWEHIERIGSRSAFSPRTVLITGAGPIGLLAALLGVQRGLEVHVLDRVADGVKPDLVHALGAVYHSGTVAEVGVLPDIAIECTAVPALVMELIEGTAINGITCLTGVSTAGAPLPVDAGSMNRELVLQNDVVFGSVNANRRHYRQAATALAAADLDWLGRLITRRVPIAEFADALTRRDDDVKVVLSMGAAGAGEG